MSTLRAILRRDTEASELDSQWLHSIVGEWQLLADMSFSDLVMWVRNTDEEWIAAAHVRPSSSGTLFYRDIVGQEIRTSWRRAVDEAQETVRIVDVVDTSGSPMRETRIRAVPVVRRLSPESLDVTERPLAVITRHSNLGQARTPSRQELSFRELANEVFAMMTTADFPDLTAPSSPKQGAPRASDGLMRLDRDGIVTFASPNALSAFARMGFEEELEGRSLAEVTTELLDEDADIDESLPLVVTGRAPWHTDIESHGVTITIRAIPLRRHGERVGAMMLCRDVTEMRVQEQTLITKDATIREIHHRVKNNLQTVAALLRIQSRRTESVEATEALQNAERRVASIAVVHDTLSTGLSQSVDFDEVFDRTVRLTSEVASLHNARVRTQRVGSFGVLPSGYATPLALALTELVTNAVEHGLAGSEDGLVSIIADRTDETLRVQVVDNGVGLEGGTLGNGLGTQIVKTLITGELSGAIEWDAAEGGGTEVTVTVPLQFLEPEEV
ncbi:sensor histidine kinase [uncultured Agrococcus sp.]|uniref:sensor histidine kinase n=1 Tax=uncultured Agrococcus sp. TaxID=382258 RepID=UPI0025DA3709|nr:PAS domain-containing sensor histidine kinase [uncultured Agrococcus sp.]